MKKMNEGLEALTTPEELAEARAVGRRAPVSRKERVVLQYLKGSAKMGLRLWNVLSPVPGYKSGGDNGFPTFSIETLREKGLLG